MHRKPLVEFTAFLVLCLLLAYCSYFSFFHSLNPGILDWKKDEYFLSLLFYGIQNDGALPAYFPRLPFELRYPTLSISHLYFPNPEVITLSPFVLLVYLSTSPLSFFRMLLAVHLLLAAIGCWLLGRGLRFNTFSRGMLFGTVILNPWLMQHIAIGYTPWFNVLLCPLIIWSLAFGKQELGYWLSLVFAALLTALILYQGGFHIFVWLFLSIAVFLLFRTVMAREFSAVLRTTFFAFLSILFAAPKLVTTYTVFGGGEQKVLKSYQSFTDLWGILTDKTVSLYKLPEAFDVYNVNIYDISSVLGECWLLAGVTAIVFFVFRLVRGEKEKGVLSFCLLLSSLLFLLLGWDGVWSALAEIAPMITVEKYPARFLILSIFCFTTFMIIEFDNQDGRSAVHRVAVISLLGGIVIQMHVRNLYFSQIAVRGEARYQIESLPVQWRAGMPVIDLRSKRRLKVEVTTQRISFKTKVRERERRIHLPRIPASRQGEYRVIGGEFVKGRGDGKGQD